MSGLDMGFYGHAGVPGINDVIGNVEKEITWGPWEYNRAFVVPVFLDGAARDAGHTDSTTVLRPGLLLGMNNSTRKWSEFDDDATDGTEVLAGVLLWDALTAGITGANRDRWFGYALVGGLVKSASILYPGNASHGIDGDANEHYVRGLMSGKYVLDDYYHQWGGGLMMGGFKAIDNRAALGAVSGSEAVTLVDADNGKLFTNLGSDAAITFTLPAVTNTKGYRAGFFVAADQSLTVAGAANGQLIVFNDVAANSVAYSTTGDKVGGFFEVIGLGSSKWMVLPRNWADGVITQTITIAT